MNNSDKYHYKKKVKEILALREGDGNPIYVKNVAWDSWSGIPLAIEAAEEVGFEVVEVDGVLQFCKKENEDVEGKV